MNFYEKLKSCKSEKEFDYLMDEETLMYTEKCKIEIVLFELSNNFTLICDAINCDLLIDYLNSTDLLIKRKFFTKVSDIDNYYFLFNFDSEDFYKFLEDNALLNIYHLRFVLAHKISFDTRKVMLNFYKNKFINGVN